MIGTVTDPRDHDRHGAPLRRAAVTIGVTLALLLSVAGLLGQRNARPHRLSRSGRAQSSAAGYLIPNELTLKADLAQKLSYAPRVIILGGSRSLRFEPGYIEKKTGLKGFNAGVRNARPEEAWGLIHFLHGLWPETRPRYLWLVHPKILSSWKTVEPPLVLDERFSRYFPQSFVDQQSALLPESAGRPERSRVRPPEWASDGHIVWSHSDDLRLATGIRGTVNQWFKNNPPGSPVIEARSRLWFTKTLGFMNHQLDATPVLVLMPVQPDVLARIGNAGLWEAHKRFTAYLRSLHGAYRFRVVDLTRIESFAGDPQDFYDGYHPKTDNTRRIIDEILRRFPHALD